jgi:dsRNA-specific ribonuclease
MLDPYDDGRIRVCIVLKGNNIEFGEGSTRKKAEQLAAKKALEKFNALPSA